MTAHKKIEELETLLAEARQAGVNAISRAEKWREALTTISNRASDFVIRDIAKDALLNI